MKKILFSILLLSVLFANSFGQSIGDQRAVSTKIADLLAQFPADNNEKLNQNLQVLANFDKPALQEMVSMLAPPGKGNNTALEYAINAYTIHATRAGNDKQRSMAVDVFCNSLRNESLGATRHFLVTQLQLIGKDDAVACLGALLNDQQLSIPVTKALAQVNSPAAQKAIFESLKPAADKSRLHIIEAVGYNRYKPAVAQLHQLASSSDADVRKIVYYSLARIADPSSNSVLQQAAKQLKYQPDNSGATSAYLLYLSNLAKKQ